MNEFGVYFPFYWLLCRLALMYPTTHGFVGLFIWKCFASLVRSLKDVGILTLWEGFEIAILQIIEYFITTVKILIGAD